MQPANRFALCVAELRILGSHRNAMLTKALRLIRELRESTDSPCNLDRVMPACASLREGLGERSRAESPNRAAGTNINPR